MYVYYCSKVFIDLECVFINELFSSFKCISSKIRNVVLNLFFIYIFKVIYYIINFKFL